MNDFNIQAAALMSGVSAHQIRAWEARHKAVKPKRLKNNFRSYTQEDITRLKLLGALTKYGISISKICSLDTSELQRDYDQLALNEKPKVESNNEKDLNVRLRFLLVFLNTQKFDILKHEIAKLNSLSSINEVIIPIMKLVVRGPQFQTEEAQNFVKSLIEQVNRILTQAYNQRSQAIC